MNWGDYISVVAGAAFAMWVWKVHDVARGADRLASAVWDRATGLSVNSTTHIFALSNHRDRIVSLEGRVGAVEQMVRETYSLLQPTQPQPKSEPTIGDRLAALEGKAGKRA